MTKQQANWSPYDNNGGTCVAIAGADYCVIAADTRMSTGYNILTRDYSKIIQLADKSVMASSGFQADVRALQKVLAARHLIYQHQHNKQMSCPAMAQLLSNTLYYKRFFPYYAFNVLGGLDNEGKASALLGWGGIQSQGSGATLITPFLDNQLKSPSPLLLPAKDAVTPLSESEAIDLVKTCFASATERDIYTGDKLEIVILNASGIRRELEKTSTTISVIFSEEMARNKEGLVLVLDVGPSMHALLPEIEKVCSMLVQKKLIYNKYDEVGVVVFGTADTKNDLTVEVGGYENVMVLRDVKVVDGDLIDALHQLPRGSAHGDFLDAIVVGMDMLIKKYGPTNKGKKRLCLITNALTPIKDPFEGTKEDQVNTVAAQMMTHGMKMDCIVIRANQDLGVNKEIVKENDFLLSVFSNRSSSKKVYVETATSLLGALRTRNISPVTIYRGDFELSSKVKIKVWVYKKTSEEKFPSLKKYSDKAPPTDKFATHEIKVDYEYKSIEDPNRVVPPEQRIKGYRYGPQVVPISSAELEAVKFKPEKGVKLLGFTDASNIMRQYYMRDVNIFIAEPGNTKAILAVSALARAMKELNKVAIIRCVWRQGQANVVVGVLTPNVSEKDNIPDSFYFNVLPFAEDVREFQFPSFSNLPPLMQPNEQQQQAADKFVQMFDLAPSGKEEALQPNLTPNPVLERYYRSLELKSKDSDAAIPPLDETLRKITEPDAELLYQNRAVIEEFHRSFELKENPKLKKSSRRVLKEKPSGSSEEGEGISAVGQAMDAIEYTSNVKVEKVGDSNPVQDFEAMISRRDSPQWITKAIQSMKDKIFDLVENSFEGDTYEKALECLAALRKGCILEQEPKQFNDFLRHLHKFCREKNLSGFSEYLMSCEMMLISKNEAPESDIPEHEARLLIVKKEPKAEQGS
ncbi:ATP-dependent DNA helicase 2 subunit KU80 [Sesamum alatum]|uniref:ATP-dependent DNA helicase 2 subunit KU80 n=2 Tax=Magnoliopsida TaxID=3398 RepID=A0AAE1XVG6_9LAMI|nr:ATP-dependent DNA helicase 2 subunit KU80 [Sesamum alatum]